MTTGTKPEMPEAWKKPEVPKLVRIPEPDHNSLAHLHSWYGPFGMYQDYRKVVVSSCHQIVRAEAVRDGFSMTDKSADAAAHLHPAYIAFLERSLEGRIAYEAEVLKKGFGQ